MFSEGLCREKKQLKKLRFWKWSPKTICYNLPSGRFFLIQNHSTLLKGGGGLFALITVRCRWALGSW